MASPRNLREDLPKIVATLARLLHTQGQEQLSTFLSQALVSVEQTDYDNWNGGTYGYTLHLSVSIEQYARLGDSVAAFETEIGKALAPLTRPYANESVDAVVISPDLHDNASASNYPRKSPTFWRDGHFRLFLSHVSQHKAEAAALSSQLAEFGISGFVAHEHIEPTREWEDEIRSALASCDALACLLIDGFHESNWCDQEIGFAVCRGVLVVPVRLGLDPYGFIARNQGFAGGGMSEAALATAIAGILAKNELTAVRMSAALVRSFAESHLFRVARARVGNLDLVHHWTDQLRATVERALEENPQIADAFGVPERVRRILSLTENQGD